MTNSNNKEWWFEDDYIQTFTLGRDENGNLNTKSRPDLEKIVAEAERRTWEAALNLIQEQKKTTDLTREGYVAWAELQIFETKIDAKLYFLTKK